MGLRVPRYDLLRNGSRWLVWDEDAMRRPGAKYLSEPIATCDTQEAGERIVRALNLLEAQSGDSTRAEHCCPGCA